MSGTERHDNLAPGWVEIFADAPEATALRRVRSSRSARDVARTLLVLLVAFAVALAVSPWQQTVAGAGRVIAFAPLERQQTVDAPIKGRIAEWYVQEGTHVVAGDPIVRIVDNDPEYYQRLERQRDAAQRRFDAALLEVRAADDSVAALVRANRSDVTAADLKTAMAQDKYDADARKLDASTAERLAAQLQVDRIRRLEAKGLESTRARELAELSISKAEADVKRAEADLRASQRGVREARANRDKLVDKNESEIQKATKEAQKARAEMSKAEQDLQKIETDLARQGTMTVTAPRDGTVLRLLVAEGQVQVKEGDALAVIVPDTTDRAVELWVDGNDAPLIAEGRPVRLQFEGWPAVQFVGWPSVAVGTFGGIVAFVDATDDGSGKFRLVVVPDPDDEPWPEGRWLRQGVRTNGWIFLNRVSLGFELWRQLNSFPPVVDKKTDADEGGKPTPFLGPIKTKAKK
jgi:multidrug resistance efflux pump